MGRIKKGQARRTPIRYKGDNYISSFQRNIWFEYGTLDNRDPNHKFKSPRRKRSLHWKGGIKPQRVTEVSWKATHLTVQQQIDIELHKSVKNWLRKNHPLKNERKH